MPTRPQPSPGNVPQEGEGPPLAPGSPVTPNDLRTVFTAVDLYRSLGRLEHAVEVLEKANVRNERDLNQLGKIAHTAKTFGNIALTIISGIGVVFFVYLYHRLAPLLFSK